MAKQKRFAGIATRSQLKVANNLGIINRNIGSRQKYRSDALETFDSYYEARQYDGLAEWDMQKAADGGYIPVRERKPRIQLNFAKMLCSRLAAKLVGQRTFPNFLIEDDPDTQDYFRIIRQTARFRAHILEPVRRELNTGSCLVRFSIVNGQWKLQHFLAKWCYPEFDINKNLSFVKIQYVFDDEQDLDDKGRPTKKWFRMDLGKMKDVLYDNPKYEDQNEPDFQVVAENEHDLGFVQAEFMVTAEQQNKIDGPSLIQDITGFIDELNYNLSQSSTAIQYNQDPQLTFSGMDDEEMAQVVRSSMKAWSLGKEGEASFLEAGMGGVEAATGFRDKIKVHLQDIARVVLLDPEKIVGHAQSGKAMEILHGPMVELIEELRPQLEKHLLALNLKMALANFIMADRGFDVPVPIPPGYKPQSLNLTVQWPEIFPPTMEDIQKKVSIAVQIANASILSRETMMGWLAKDFGVEDLEAELEKVNAQPVINPFGGF